jgi:hypothetical protein
VVPSIVAEPRSGEQANDSALSLTADMTTEQREAITERAAALLADTRSATLNITKSPPSGGSAYLEGRAQVA